MTINYNGTIKSLRDIVWGVVTDPLSQIEQITLLIFIKLLSERHNELERLKAKKLIFTGEYASYHFDSLSRLSGYELVDTARKAIESLYKNPNIDEPIRRLYERSYLQVNDPRVLSLLINEINKIDIAHIDMGDFYEHLLSVLGTQKEAGQFRTPRHLIEFIVDIVNPQIGERMLDPACGTAGFLTAAYTHIRDANTSQEARKSGSFLDKLNFDQKTFLLNKTIFGFDIDPKMIKFAISNLYLHNIKNPNISQHNTLTSNDSWEEKYDVILTNPPFSTPKGGVKPTDRYTLDSKRTEVLFAEYVIEHLTLNGRAGVIVPEGIIFQSGKAYKELRKWLVENNYLYAVVSLPAGVFSPYAINVTTSILLLDRERARQTDKILFCRVENDGFDLGAQRRPIDKNDLPEVLKVVKEYKANPDKPIDSTLAHFVTKDKIIKSGDYNLTGDRYKETISIANKKWPIIQLGNLLVEEKNRAKEKKYPVWSVSNYLGFVLTNKYFDKQISSKDIKNYKKILKDYFAYNPSRINVGSIALNDKEEVGVVSPMYVVFSIADQKRLNPKYLFMLLKSKTFLEKVKQLSQGAVRRQLRFKDLREIEISLPPLSVQQQIFDEIDSFQKVINGANQVVDNYKPQIKIDPSWKLIELRKLCFKVHYGISKQLNTESKGYKIFRMNEIFNMQIIDSGNMKYVDIPKREFEKYRLNKGDILFNRTNSFELVGKTGIFNLDGDYCFASYLIRLIIDKTKVFPKYVNYLLNLGYFQSLIKNIATKTAGQSNVNAKNLCLIQIPTPNLKIQKQIISQIEEEQKLVEANKKLIQLFEQKIKDKIAEVWGN